MNKSCGRCSKVVYQVELVTAADKSWHKKCFNCADCKTALTQRTFTANKGEIYCQLHVPKWNKPIKGANFGRREHNPLQKNAAPTTKTSTPTPASTPTTTSEVPTSTPASATPEPTPPPSAMPKTVSAPTVKTHDIKPAPAPPAAQPSFDIPPMSPMQVDDDIKEYDSNKCCTCEGSIDKGEDYAYHEHRTWHIKCFKCRKCDKAFDATAEFVPHSTGKGKQRIFCVSCFEEKKANRTPCGFCKQGIKPSEDRIKFDSDMYHNECFRCSTCNQALDISAFYYKDGAFACDRCESSAVCIHCNKAIKDTSYPMIADEPYHPACVICAVCNIVLENPYSQNGKLLCEEHVE